jgi:hypothetical protein
MKYTIFSVDDSRQHYIDMMTPKLEGWEREQTDCVDGRISEQLQAAQEKFPYEVNYQARLGQLGIWYSVLNALDHAPIVTFEDDALLHSNFQWEFDARIAELPEDFDFFSLFIPRDSDHIYTTDRSAGWFICKTYQRYGGVSMYYSENGAKKIKSLLERDGITGQYDDTLYEYSKRGELNGYCSKPIVQDLVYITGTEESIVQETEYA